MEYQVLELIYPYLDKKESIFQALVCREWFEIIKFQGQGGSFVTPYSILVSPTLLSYSNSLLNLVYNEKIAKAIIKIGDLETIKLFGSTYDLRYDRNYMDLSAKHGHLETMKWLFKNGSKLDIHTFDAAARNGNISAMKWLLDNRCGFKYAVENGCPH